MNKLWRKGGGGRGEGGGGGGRGEGGRGEGGRVVNEVLLLSNKFIPTLIDN